MFTIHDLGEYILKCLCLRSSKDAPNNVKLKKHFLFKKAENKFMQELDVVRIVKTLQ